MRSGSFFILTALLALGAPTLVCGSDLARFLSIREATYNTPANAPNLAGELFREPELWVWPVKWLGEIENLLNKYVSDPATKKEILEAIRLPGKRPGEIEKRLKTFMAPADLEHFASLSIPSQLRDRLPKDFLWEIYKVHRVRLKLVFPAISEYPSFEALKQNLLEYKLSPSAMREVARDAFLIDGKVHVAWTAGLKSYLPAAMVEDLKSQFGQGKDFASKGYDILLRYAATDDLKALSKALAGERDPSVVEAELALLLKKSPNQRVTVPLAQVMHPFIRNNFEAPFEREAGPNCHNCALSVNEGKSFTKAFTLEPELENRLKNGYHPIAPGEPLQAGDLLLYTNFGEKGVPVPIHSATYIGQAGDRTIVYTKNGKMATSPYMFSDKKWVDEGYQRYFDARAVYIFRKGKGSGTVGSFPPYSTAPYEYIFNCSARFSELKRTPEYPTYH